MNNTDVFSFSKILKFVVYFMLRKYSGLVRRGVAACISSYIYIHVYIVLLFIYIEIRFLEIFKRLKRSKLIWLLANTLFHVEI